MDKPARPPFIRVGVALVTLAQVAGCATVTTVTPLPGKFERRANACHVSVIGKHGQVPAGETAIARIESHIERDFFFGGRVSLLDDAYQELRVKACELGGDEVRVDDAMESAAGEMTHVHVWATVFRRD